MSNKVFISYRKLDLSKQESVYLRKILVDAEYEVFLDVAEMPVGSHWQNTIYNEVRTSGVLIVLLEPGTEKSEWVQREVDVARGAQVSILPIRLGHEEFTDEQIHAVQEKLVITDTHYGIFCSEQYINDHALTRNQREFIAVKNQEIFDTIESLIINTRSVQRKWAKEVAISHAQRPAVYEPEYARFPIKNKRGEEVNIYLSVGDLTKFRNVDVIVNSENDYLQMARFFENYTISSQLRHLGATDNNGLFLHDRIQEELDDKMETVYRARPIPLGQVLVTSAGHPQSALVQRGIRYIFHVVTSRVNTIKHPFFIEASSDSDVIRTLVNNCLSNVVGVDTKEVPIFYSNARFRRAIPDKPIESIVFPIFGAGHGALEITDVLPHMAGAMMEFIRNDNQSHLKHIFLCVYAKQNVKNAKRFMTAEWNKHRA